MKVRGANFVIVGALEAFPRRLAAREIVGQGGELRRGISRRTTFAVFGHRLLDGASAERIAARIDEARRSGATLLSENGFLMLLGLAAAPETSRDLSTRQLRDQSGLDGPTFEHLRLFDAFETPSEPFGFRDLVAAKQYARLAADGVDWLGIVRAARSRRLAAPGSGVPGSRLTRAGTDVLMQSGPTLAELSGQLLLELPPDEADPVDRLFEAAVDAEEAEDWPRAAALYRRSLAIDPNDPDIAFNLSHVLMQMGDLREARVYLNKVLKRDPAYAEAWYNLAAIAREEKAPEAARRHLRNAIAADPGYPDPLYNLALLEFDTGNYGKAAELWQRYSELDPDSAWGRKARYGLQLIAMMAEGGPTESVPAADRRNLSR